MSSSEDSNVAAWLAHWNEQDKKTARNKLKAAVIVKICRMHKPKYPPVSLLEEAVSWVDLIENVRERECVDW